MTKRDLVEALEGLDDDAPVLIEGPDRAAMEIAYVWPGVWDAFDWVVGLEDLTEEDEYEGWTAEDVIAGGDPAIILSPVAYEEED